MRSEERRRGNGAGAEKVGQCVDGEKDHSASCIHVLDLSSQLNIKRFLTTLYDTLFKFSEVLQSLSNYESNKVPSFVELLSL